MSHDSETGRRFYYSIITIALAALAFLVTPNFLKARARRSFMPCKSNCVNIAKALDLYAADNQGQYPPHLADLLKERYLNQIPTCPAADADTYSLCYQVSANPKAFSFACTGNNHPKVYAGFPRPCDNYPRYNSSIGLIDHP